MSKSSKSPRSSPRPKSSRGRSKVGKPSVKKSVKHVVEKENIPPIALRTRTKSPKLEKSNIFVDRLPPLRKLASPSPVKRARGSKIGKVSKSYKTARSSKSKSGLYGFFGVKIGA